MPLKLINIGFGNIIMANRIIAVISPDSAPIKRMIQEQRSHGRVVDATYGRRVSGRVKLGFSLVEIESQEDIIYWSQYSKYFTDYGIYIIESESADFQTGDRIIALDSISVDSIATLKSMLLEYSIGDKVTVTISRLTSNKRSEIKQIELVLTEKTNDQ